MLFGYLYISPLTYNFMSREVEIVSHEYTYQLPV